MADTILMSGGVGGVTSDDVTARREHVLQGYTALTADSDDEPAEGGIQIVDTSQNNYTKTRTTEYGLDKSRSAFYMHLPQKSGYYTRSDNKPHVEIDSSLLGDALSSDVVDTKTATSKNGVAMRGTLQYKGNGGAPNGVICPEMFYYTSENAYVARFDAGAYYNTGERGQWKPYVSVPIWMAKQATNYHPEKTLSDTVTCQERGTVKMIDTKLNNYTNNQARNMGIDYGRGKLWMELGHGNAYYYRDDNVPHVETDSANLGDVTADKVMRGFTATSKHGVKFAGTMPDLQSGRTVFNGATFDNVLVSGVAAKGFYANGTYYAYNIQSGYAYGGIYGGGMNLQLNTTYTALRSRRIGCVLSQSINVTPFRQIVIYYRSVANIQGNPYVSLEAHVSRASVRGQVNVSGAIVDTIDVVRQGTASPVINREGQIVLDVSNINEHIFLSFGAFCNQDRASDIFAGAVQITRIDFLN